MGTEGFVNDDAASFPDADGFCNVIAAKFDCTEETILEIEKLGDVLAVEPLVHTCIRLEDRLDVDPNGTIVDLHFLYIG